MKFEVKKKVIADAAKVIRTMNDALSASGAAADVVHVIAEGNVLKLQSVAGGQAVERTIREGVVVTEEGSAAVDPTSLSGALAASGDTFKVAQDGNFLTYVCGRARGRMEVKLTATEPADLSTFTKASINIPGFRDMVRAMRIKSYGGSNERTIHVDAKKRIVRGESTDSLRTVTFSAVVSGDNKLTHSADISLPSKALDALVEVIDEAALVGFDESFFVVKSPGLFICMPQSASPAIDIAGDVGDMLESQKKVGSFTVLIKELLDSLKDAVAMSTEKDAASFTLQMSPDGGIMRGANGSVEVDFGILATDVTEIVKVQTAPALLVEAFSSYRVTDKVVVTVYEGMVTVDLPESTELVQRQQVALPVASVSTEPMEKRRVVKAAPPAEEPEKPVKKAPKKVVEEEEAPPPKPKKAAPPPVEDDEDEESFDDEE